MNELEEKEIVIDELMQLYENSPNLKLYKDDLLEVEQSKHIEQIAGMYENGHLNPLDVVLESLINVLSEKLSIDSLTGSAKTVYVDKSIQELAMKKIVDIVRGDVSFLKAMHDEWLRKLRFFLSNLSKTGVQTLQEAIFQVSVKFRISASSSLRAINSLMQT